jgi:hypothetical protein
MRRKLNGGTLGGRGFVTSTEVFLSRFHDDSTVASDPVGVGLIYRGFDRRILAIWLVG